MPHLLQVGTGKLRQTTRAFNFATHGSGLTGCLITTTQPSMLGLKTSLYLCPEIHPYTGRLLRLTL